MVQDLPIPNLEAEALLDVTGVQSLGKRDGTLVVNVRDQASADRAKRHIEERGLGVPYRIDIVGDFIPAQRLQRHRPVPMGVSIGHHRVTAGTSSWALIDEEGKLYTSSNRHVYAPLGHSLPGDPILQPGSVDGGVPPGDTVAILDGWVVPEQGFQTDLAWAKPLLSYDVMFDNEFFDGDSPVRPPLASIVGGKTVFKDGAKSGLTSGEIIETSVSLTFDGDLPRMDNQFTTNAFVADGDSGSPVYTVDDNEQRRPAGMVWGVFRSEGMFTKSICSPASAIERESGMTIFAPAGEGGGPHPLLWIGMGLGAAFVVSNRRKDSVPPR